ncbi:cytidine deaminase [Amycolatopsis acidicola]|uniref:Cytidine deaminase n=1 Tax=Amycolatopsis acidicola TaxID=2596893 RepID=A0A5N0VL94_9PSEU|nr:cytidine deaminase [Amycolatopsis acidicola]KAA9165502.1 cytidine deaminase [Amycolatopsis acidicola]
MESYPGVTDTDLWQQAVSLLGRGYRHERHEVAAALRTRGGAVFTGLHVAGSAGRSSICAEGVALGAALTAGDRDVEAVVAVLYRPAGTVRVIAPCGVCRELLYDYCPDASIYLHEGTEPTPPGDRSPGIGFTTATAAPGVARRVAVRDLMPGKNPRAW